jgi:hypothetical protein
MDNPITEALYRRKVQYRHGWGKYSLLGDCCELAAVVVIAVSAPAVIITGAITVYSLGAGY